MTTLIKRKKFSGPTTGRCDAKCYNAKSKKCKCVCLGLNHGKGLEKAQYMTAKNRDLILSKRRPGECFIIQLQTQLFYG